MIIPRVFGGLGNQLFVYAAARRLAIKTQEKLVLDLRSGFPRDFYKRTPELHIFDIRCDEAGALAAMEFRGGRAARFALKKLARGALPGVLYFSEPSPYRFHPEILDLAPKPITFLEGYWQCERYFADVERVIRDDLRMVQTHDDKNRAMMDRILATRAPVAVHARRLRAAPKGHGHKPAPDPRAPPVEYYVEAMRRIRGRVPGAHFFCFADYADWFRESFDDDGSMTIVDVNGYGDARAYEDLWLMRACRHFIASNSSFAWWAAWLGEAKDKMVLAPDASFWDNKDVLPSSWEALGPSDWAGAMTESRRRDDGVPPT